MSGSNKHYSGFSNAGTSAMASRFDETVIQDTDVILTTKGGEQVRILLSQLVNADNFCNTQFDMSSSTYFNKHYDISMQKPYKIGDAHLSVDELAESMMSDLKDNYIDKNMADEGAEGGQDQVCVPRSYFWAMGDPNML